jgi:general transcription factor 3C polypeptide 3 (transcription factor C subunit 4)
MEHPASEHLYLFRLVAEHLFEMSLYKDALNFLRPLKSLNAYMDGPLLVQMGKCFLHVERDREAEECFQNAVQLDGQDIEARMELAHLYERMGKPEEAFNYVNEVMLLRKSQGPKIPRKLSKRTEGLTVGEKNSTATKEPRPRPKQPRQQAKKQFTQVSRAEHLQRQYSVLRKEFGAMRSGDVASVDIWMDAARDLTDDFRSFKTFFPLDKYIKFLGYSGDSRVQAETPLDSDLAAMAERLSRGMC